MLSFLALMMQADTIPPQQLPGWAAAALGAGIGLGIGTTIVLIAAGWKIFQKAGQPGWASIVPIYNLIVLIKILNKPMSWVIFCLIPFVNFVMVFVLAFALAKTFGKGGGFALGLLFLPPIFYSLLAWGNARYMPQPA
jgi:uncharacterized protein DUF5684